MNSMPAQWTYWVLVLNLKEEGPRCSSVTEHLPNKHKAGSVPRTRGGGRALTVKHLELDLKEAVEKNSFMWLGLSCHGRRERTSHFTRANKLQYRKTIFPTHPGSSSQALPVCRVLQVFPGWLEDGEIQSRAVYCTGLLLDSKQTRKSL